MIELQRIVRVREIDKEFDWMLNCYFGIVDFILTPRQEFGELVVHLENMPQWDPALASKFTFAERGQLGDYWISRNDTGGSQQIGLGS